MGRAFGDAHKSGRYGAELQGALAAVLVRHVEDEGWEAGYRAMTPGGDLVPLADWFSTSSSGMVVDAVNRLNFLAGPLTGDLLLISHYGGGYYFGGETRGVHGGLHPQDSRASMAFAWPDGGSAEWRKVKGAIQGAIQARCDRENGRLPGTCDLVTGLETAAPTLFQSPVPQ